MTIDIEIHSLGCSGPDAPEKWAVLLDGEEICRHRVPFYTAARVLLARGVSPEATLRMRHRGSNTIAMTGSIGAMAKRTVRETQAGGPVEIAWHPFPENGRLPAHAIITDGQVGLQAIQVAPTTLTAEKHGYRGQL
jgi:hypothetical protein